MLMSIPSYRKDSTNKTNNLLIDLNLNGTTAGLLEISLMNAGSQKPIRREMLKIEIDY